MRRFLCAFAALIAVLRGAGAETISLLCGYETVIVDTDAISVRVQEASLEKQTSEYNQREFKDGNKHKFFGAQVRDYMSVTDVAISYGHDDGPHVNAVYLGAADLGAADLGGRRIPGQPDAATMRAGITSRPA